MFSVDASQTRASRRYLISPEPPRRCGTAFLAASTVNAAFTEAALSDDAFLNDALARNDRAHVHLFHYQTEPVSVSTSAQTPAARIAALLTASPCSRTIVTSASMPPTARIAIAKCCNAPAAFALPAACLLRTILTSASMRPPAARIAALLAASSCSRTIV